MPKRCKAVNLTHREIVNSNDKKNVAKQTGKERQFSIGVNLMGKGVKSLHILSENQRISENVDFDKHQVD
jgi:hypothetical protein